ncbi:MAG: DnaJ domain-containing protein, partial [Deltaproteobacteria bacterium]|nr:DnaJ domain-containing protein [Deltaproteobacteria bacterium]
MDLKNCYKILEIQQTASLSEIKQAYRDMIGIWHPDRYVQNPRLHEKATEKLKELNIAFNELISRKTSGIVKNDAGSKASKNDAPLIIVTCPGCQKKKRRLLNKWTMLFLIACIGVVIVDAGEIRHKLTKLLKQIPEGRYVHYFKDPSLTPLTKSNTATASSAILQIQQSLQKFGYATYPLDGVWGEQTLAAVQQFRDDYFLEFRVDDVTELTKALQRQRAIIKLHPDWPHIATDSRFKLWIEQQIMTSPEICRQLLASGEVRQVVSLLGWYKFHRLPQKPVPMPRNGALNKNYNKGLAPLSIQTRNDGRHYYLKLL